MLVGSGHLHFIESAIQMPLMELPVRSTVVVLNAGKILISPGSKMRRDNFSKENQVTDIVAPNWFHSAGTSLATEWYPQAKLWAAPGLIANKPQLKWSGEIYPSNWPYQEELPAVWLQGMPKVNEVVFVHRESKSLIVADLCFNMLNIRGLGAWIILNLFGTYNKVGVSRFFTSFVADKGAFRDSLKLMFSYDFENLIVSHGDNVIGGAKDQLRQALRARGFGDI